MGLSLVEGLTPALLERLAAGDADVAVVSSFRSGPIDGGRFELHHLLDERLLVAVPRDHRLAGRDQVRLAELAGDAFIAGSATAEETLLRLHPDDAVTRQIHAAVPAGREMPPAVRDFLPLLTP